MSLYAMGKAYGTRPSAWIDGLDEIGAYQLDLAALQAGSDEERAVRDREKALADAKARRDQGMRRAR